MSTAAFDVTSWIFAACCAAYLFRIVMGPNSVDRLTSLAAISALVLGILVMRGVKEGRAAFLDVALVYDILGFLGILAIATFTKDLRSGAGRGVDGEADGSEAPPKDGSE
jgi:multicomponent Na+:H+ antiporter subunit F